MNEKEKRRTILGAVRQIFKNGGTVTNKSARQFLAEAGKAPSNPEIIDGIDKQLSKLSKLTSEDRAKLNGLLDRHNLLVSTNNNQHDTQSPKYHTLQLNDSLSITDLSSQEQNFNDEYSFMLTRSKSNYLPKRLYLVQCIAYNGDYTVRFTNYIFGNLTLEKNNIQNLTSALSRENVTQSLVNSLGFISISDETCTSEAQYEMFQKLYKCQPHANLKRSDSSDIFVLKVGNMVISSHNHLDENLDQYIILVNSRVFLSYGKVNFELLSTSKEYENLVANQLLSAKNLASSSHIGWLNGDFIVKSNAPFGKAITSGIKYQMAL